MGVMMEEMIQEVASLSQRGGGEKQKNNLEASDICMIKITFISWINFI